METVRLTYQEMRKHWPGSADAARMRAKREAAKPGSRWRIIPGNHPNDPVHVEIPADEIPEQMTPLLEKEARTIERQVQPPPEFAPASLELAGRLVAELRFELGRRTDQLVAEKEAHGATRAELATATAELGHARAELELADQLAERRGRQLEAERARSWFRKLIEG